MPNSEYLRLKALLESNPQYKIYLDTISKAEGTWGKDAYSTTFGGGKSDWRKGKDKTVRNNSSAHGKYQFMNDTWKSLQEKLELTGFSPEEQDVAALKLAEEAGALKHIDNGDMKQAIFAGAPIWAALPKDSSGRSAMKGQKAKPLATVLNYTKSNEAARAAINNNLKNLNEQNAQKYLDYKKGGLSKSIGGPIEEKVKSYWKEISRIQSQKDVSEEEKNLQKHAVKKKYYSEGLMAAINVDINETNKEYNSLIKEMSQMAGKSNEKLVDENGYINPNAGIVTKQQFEKIKEKAKKFNIDLGNPKYNVAGGDESNKKATRYVNPQYIDKKIKEMGSIYTPRKMEPALLKYGKTKDEYDAEVAKNAPVDSSVAPMMDASTNKTPEEIAQEKKAANEQAVKNAQAMATKEKPFEGSDVLNKWDDQEMFADPKFKYTPGKAKIPFDALIGLTTGLVGAAEADSVQIKERDEELAEGMIQYAQDLERIKNIGLPPEIEAGLKLKLADAYQTGLQNIVRASNGNRNLVLGNQGQLDQARMNGIVEIAAMDMDRSDKAMAAFGEVQKYINEFESRKDIANNERQYQEDQKKQIAGMQLAQQGMSSFIDSVQYAKENAPGTMNDMKRQYFQFKATGILPNAKPGEPGSAEALAAMQLQHDMLKGKKRTFADWKNTLNLDEQKLLHDIVVKNPNLNPSVNKDAKFEDLEKMFNDISGNESNKKAFYESKGLSELTTSQVQADVAKGKKEATGQPQEVVPIVRQTLEPGKEIPEDQKRFMGTKPKTQEEIYGTPVLNADGSFTINNKKIPAPESKIVTTEKLADNTMQQLLDNGANGLPTGPDAIDPEKDASDRQYEQYTLKHLQGN